MNWTVKLFVGASAAAVVLMVASQFTSSTRKAQEAEAIPSEVDNAFIEPQLADSLALESSDASEAGGAPDQLASLRYADAGIVIEQPDSIGSESREGADNPELRYSSLTPLNRPAQSMVESPLPDMSTVRTSVGLAEVKEDLVLRGVIGLGSAPRAMFTVAETGGDSTEFSLREGQSNDWLQVVAIDAPNGRVRAILKRPVMRIRNAGHEVILSFKVHGATH